MPDAETLRLIRDRQDRFERELDELRRRVDQMSESDKIARAVTDAIEVDRRARFTFTRKIAGAIAAVILLVPAVHDAVGWLSG